MKLFLSGMWLAGSLTVGHTALPAQATPAERAQQELNRSEIQANRQAIISRAMELTSEESDRFWPTYRDYRNEIAKATEQSASLMEDYAANWRTLPDKQAFELVEDYQKGQKDKLDVERKYADKFRKFLPGRKVMRFFQLESKLDAAINFDLAQQVPLAP
jgi:hypothetical protein